MAPASVNVEMADYASSLPTAGLSPPPFSEGSEYENVHQQSQQTSPDQAPALVDNINLDPTFTATELDSMRRSARNTNKPKTVIVTSPSRPTKRKITTRVMKKTPKWTTQKLLTDPKSPLANADLRMGTTDHVTPQTILCQPAAWDILSKEERAEIIALFPPGTRILDPDTENARLDLDSLRNDNNFRHDCATYTDNIAMGKHDPEWLEQAFAARERRRAGDFDSYLKQKFEDEWSCELPEGFGLNRDGNGPTNGVTAAEEQRKEEGETQMEAKVKNAEGTEYAEVTQEQPNKDTRMIDEGDSEEVVDVKLGSPASQTHEIQLGSPIPEESGVKLGSPIPEP